MLLLFVGWFVLACLLALLIGPILKESGKPTYVSDRDWDRITHIPHTPGFARRQK